MRKVGTIKLKEEMAGHPDFDITREDEIEGETTTPVTRITLEQRRSPLRALREIAQDNFEAARGYIGVGLQIDPHNESLRLLQELAVPSQGGFFDALASLFK